MQTRTLARTALAATLWIGFVDPGVADDAPAERTAEQIEACMRRNMPEHASIQTVTFRVNGKDGVTTDSEVKIFWTMGEDGFSKILMRFEAPMDMRDSALLLIEKAGRNDMFMYLPEIGRVRRVTGPTLSGGMFGTDFTYSQFERLQGVARDLEVEKRPDGELDGRAVHVLSHTPADDPEFVHVLTYVDPERCVPLRTEFFESGDRLRKVLQTEEPSIRKVERHWIPHRMVMRDVVQGTSTEFNVDSIDTKARIHRKMFTQSELAKGN